MQQRIDTDLCVIGGGSGGLSVAAGAAQLGADVVLLEGGRIGGDCLNAGCVPSKALIAAAGAAQTMRDAGPFGIAAVEPQVDYAQVMRHVSSVIAAIAPHDSVERFEGLGVRVIPEYGRFISPREVEAGGTVIRARRFVVATGSSPVIPRISGLEGVGYLTNESIFALRVRPEHLIVIGGGPVGVELAQAHRRLGCRVTIIEADRLLAAEDPELVAVVEARLRGEDIKLLMGAPVTEVHSGQGDIIVRTSDQEIRGTHLLLAVGRKPNLERLDLDRAAVRSAPAGVLVDKYLRTSNRRIHAIGDVTGKDRFTHAAGYQANIVIRSALFGIPAKARRDHIPRVTYTDPELAHVGVTEEEARVRLGERAITVVRFPFTENDRAQAERATEGMVKVVVHRGRPIGASIVGHHAGELIGQWALALSAGLSMSAVAGAVLPYPTLSEVTKRAAGAYFSPRLFGNPLVKRLVGIVQTVLP